MKRRAVDGAIDAGAPLLVYWYGGGALKWFEGVQAHERWLSCRSAFTSEPPRLGGDMVWTGGLWLSDDEAPLVVLEGHC